MLKEYVIDLREFKGKLRELISTGLQEHAFMLGWIWGFGGKIVNFTKSAILYLHDDGMICHDNDMRSRGTITPADFLALTPEDVQDEPEKPRFEPTQMVLGRNKPDRIWRLDIYSHHVEENSFPHACVGGSWPEIIPYEGNEHLCGQVGEPSEASK